MQRLFLAALLAAVVCAPWTIARAQSGPCVRPDAGAIVSPPPDLYSQQGVLTLALKFSTTMDNVGHTLFCFTTPDTLESPTLHVHPGDTLDVTVTNTVPALPAGAPTETVSDQANECGDQTMTGTSVNVHFHGMNIAPTCHSDDVIHTLINSGQTFHYVVQIPLDEPPGLYWYHPHVHGISEASVLGGASGAIVVEGIENFQPTVAGLPSRLLLIRDQTVAASPISSTPVPAWDLSLNYVPVSYPAYTPAVLSMPLGQKELWRVVNAAADTIIDLQLRFDGQAQPLQVVGLDGVPVNSQDGSRQGHIVSATHVRLPPAARAEFIVTGPTSGVKQAELVTQNIDTGPDGDFDPERPLAIIDSETPPTSLPTIPNSSASSSAPRFAGLNSTAVSSTRKLYFSEVVSDPSNPASPTNFFITADGATPELFDPLDPPRVTTTQGSVEDWTIENRSGENHEFHIHQIHFQLLAINGAPAQADQQQMLDMVEVPYWSGQGSYPSVTVRMDFRGPDVGDFVYHCHILGHEDNGMMGIIRVLPKPQG